DSVTVADLMGLQNDNFNLKAQESLPFLVSVVDTMKLNEFEQIALNELKNWDYYNNIDSKGAAYYEDWWDLLYPSLWKRIDDEKVSLVKPTTFNTIRLLKEHPDMELFYVPGTPEKENAYDHIVLAFRQMSEQMANWRASHAASAGWAEYKGTYVKHLLRLEPFGRYDIPIGGNHKIVNATSENHGPSWRMVVDLNPNGVKAYGVYPGGQSGNPASSYYDDMIDVWAAGKYFDLSLMHEPNENPENILIQQTLTPNE
ncbi:MAG: penicillin acylase family protein, partial [Bacteroidetes bacterium]|nr:penicillin acylase family protein [Bacteroidota bacterium]